jgi:hypothetical protein
VSNHVAPLKTAKSNLGNNKEMQYKNTISFHPKIIKLAA